jgi:nitrogenase molybdenum-iron protein NifN
MLKPSPKAPKFTVTRNACKLCTPLGAALVFKGIRGAVPLLHGSQGCSTYIRRYLISHYREPIDIACSNFSEQTAIFGGGANLKIALDNIRRQYDPEMIGVATTCLSETIGDDVPMFIREYRESCAGEDLPPMVHVATPSYQGTHMQGFHAALRAVVDQLAQGAAEAGRHVNLFPGMVSPADMRHLREICADFDLPVVLLPDYADTLDGPLWAEYQRIPEGGTSVAAIRSSGSARASLELGDVLARAKETAAGLLWKRFEVPCHRMGLPVGIDATDRMFAALAEISGRPTPENHLRERGRLIDSYADGHKYVMDARAVVFGEEDLVVGLAGFLGEIGVVPVVCASGGRSGHLAACIAERFPDHSQKGIQVLSDADFVTIETAARDAQPDFLIGNSKGYSMARRLDKPLIRVGFPVHDRVGGARLLHLGYRGSQQLFDRIANTLMAARQTASPVGYTYM